MKKIMIIDGGPRKNMNTAALVQAFAEGPSCFIYTMNAPKEMVHVQQRNMEENEMIVANALGKPEHIDIYNTL